MAHHESGALLGQRGGETDIVATRSSVVGKFYNSDNCDKSQDYEPKPFVLLNQ
jgi:hypothetical protein